MTPPLPPVSVLIPWRADGSERSAALAFVVERLAHSHPDWEVVLGVLPEGPWYKAEAVENGLERARGEVLVIHDADVWCDELGQAVTQVQQGTSWAIPYWHVHRLAQGATKSALATNEIRPGAPLEHPAYAGLSGGGITVLEKEAYLCTPLDPHFKG